VKLTNVTDSGQQYIDLENKKRENTEAKLVAGFKTDAGRHADSKKLVNWWLPVLWS